MKTYTLFWRTGDAQIVTGPDVETACNNAGVGAGALPALDFWARGDVRDEHEWDAENREWMDAEIARRAAERKGR